jgi:hypothetical protein
MKRWAALTVLLYALALILLTAPVIGVAFEPFFHSGKNSGGVTFHDLLQLYLNWGYLLWLAVLVAGQILLLLVPIDIAERRLPARRKLKVPVLVAAFFLGNLFFAGALSIACAIFGDKTANDFDLAGANDKSGFGLLSTGILTLLFFWLIWSILFRSFAKSDDAGSLVKRATRWLLRGSILELIIAVPSHVIVRRRDDCCAPIGTFWGIATGISVMLLCFGPGVYFLFVERCKRLQPKSANTGKSAS